MNKKFLIVKRAHMSLFTEFQLFRRGILKRISMLNGTRYWVYDAMITLRGAIL